MLIKSYLVVMIKLVNFTNRIESKQNEVTKCHICPMDLLSIIVYSDFESITLYTQKILSKALNIR